MLAVAERRRTRRSQAKFDPKRMFNRGLIAQTGFLPEHTQLLQDSWPLKVIDTKDVLSEAAGHEGRKAMRITGVFQRAGEPNANGRIYTKPILGEAVEALQEDLASMSVWGEFDHPSDGKIHLDRISHLITKVWMEGNDVLGEAEIIDELPFGNQLRVLLKHGRVGISSRGIGDLEVREENGQEYQYVCEGYRVVTFDVVAEPSVRGAVMQLVEGKLRPFPQKKLVTDGVLSKALYQRMLASEIRKYMAR